MEREHAREEGWGVDKATGNIYISRYHSKLKYSIKFKFSLERLITPLRPRRDGVQEAILQSFTPSILNDFRVRTDVKPMLKPSRAGAPGINPRQSNPAHWFHSLYSGCIHR
jgi:hypothetical protein